MAEHWEEDPIEDLRRKGGSELVDPWKHALLKDLRTVGARGLRTRERVGSSSGGSLKSCTRFLEMNPAAVAALDQSQEGH